MTSRSGPQDPTFGFLTVVEQPRQGLLGGYLLLGETGRPLEFHCTAPIKPSRAQEILYGPTLRPFLYGEQIGVALASHANIQPALIITDVANALELDAHVAAPVVFVQTEEPAVEASTAAAPDNDVSSFNATPSVDRRIDSAHAKVSHAHWLTIGTHRVALAADHANQTADLQRRLSALAARIDLTEPFERIRQAIDEAQRGNRG